jgi:hypothetical protein
VLLLLLILFLFFCGKKKLQGFQAGVGIFGIRAD